MSLNNLISLDESLTYGDILGAVQRHFAKDVTILYDDTKMVGKDLRLRSLSDFLQSIKQVNKINIQDHQGTITEIRSSRYFDVIPATLVRGS